LNEAGAPVDKPRDSTEPHALDRMAKLRHLVRRQGMSAEAAAKEVGVDPIIAQLWLRLPDDLWPAAATSASVPLPRPSATTLSSVPPAAPGMGLRRVITCRVPAPALDRLRASSTPLLDAAVAALDAGLAQPRPERAPGGWQIARRPLAVPVPSAAFADIVRLAAEAFDGDVRDAAGWLIARGLGMTIPLPTTEELAGTPVQAATARTERLPLPAARFVVPPRRRPEPRAPLPADDSAPSGDELRVRREALGISQRDLAAASGLSRGLVAEVERGRRRHVLTRLRLSETLASLERGSPAPAKAVAL
jgi:DNA-binding XRE family transcriptional regulator